MYFLSSNCCNYIFNLVNSSILIWQGPSEIGAHPHTKSISHLGGKTDISLRNTSRISMKTANSSKMGLLNQSFMFINYTANILHPFRAHLFSCKVDIYLTIIGLGIPLIVLSFPSSSIHVNVLFKKFIANLWDSSQFMPMRTSYDPKCKNIQFYFCYQPIHV